MANEEHLAILKQGVEVWNQWREENPDIQPFLNVADLSGTDLGGTDLREANLLRADLSDTILTHTRVGWTSFGDVDLSTAQGLDTVEHGVPSTIGIDTIYKSKGNIPEAFLRGAGVPDSFTEFTKSLARAGQAIEYYSCFISYSSDDEDLAQRLYNDLQGEGVRCWYAPHDMKIGAKIRPTLDETIRLHEKTLLLLSESSVNSQWVEQEVETALAEERRTDRTLLFPIRLDDAVMEVQGGWPALVKRTRNIGDFTQWKDHDAYQPAFSRLLRDLKAEE